MFNKKIILKIIFLYFAIFLYLIFSSQKSISKSNTISSDFLVAFVTDVGGFGDKSYNDESYKGLLKASKEFDIEVKTLESLSQSDYLPNILYFAKEKAKLVFAVDFLMADALLEAARINKNNPYTYFAGIDIFIDPYNAPKNVAGILFKENEAGYLAGILAGLLTYKYSDALPYLNKTNMVGIVLGMDIPPVERYQAGFYAGVKAVNPTCEVISVVTNVFNDPAKGKYAATKLYNMGCDIIFHIAGLTGNGVFDAAKEKKGYAIGVDFDQNYLEPDVVITSAEKKFSEATYLTIKSVIYGTFKGGTNIIYGLKEGGVGLADFHTFKNKIPTKVKETINKATQDIINGIIVVPDTRTQAGYRY